MKKTFGLLLALMCSMAINATELYLVGTATPAQWQTGPVREKTQLHETFVGSNVFVYIGEIPGNPNYTSGMAQNRFKIVDGLESWTGFSAEQSYTDITNKIGSVVSRPADNSTYPDNFWFVRETATYKVIVDLNKKKIHCFKYEAPSIVDGAYQLATFSDLVWFSDNVNERGETTVNGKLTADLSQGERIYSPIGSTTNPYQGIFNGDGYSVTLALDNPAYEYQGIFGVLTGGAQIKNLTAKGFVTGRQYVGGIAGGTNGEGPVSFTCCGNEANVTATSINAAGILGVNIHGEASVSILNCFNSGEIRSDIEGGAISGWVGKSSSRVQNCYNIGKLYNNDVEAADFARSEDAQFENCYYADYSGTSVAAGNNLVSVTSEQVGNGALCFMLGDVFRQTIGTDIKPLFGESHMKVYGNNAEIYSNYGVAIGNSLYATMVAPTHLEFDNHMVKAFGAKALTDKVLLMPTTSVQEGECIVVYAAQEGEYALPVLTESPGAIDENQLQASKTDIDADGSQYVLAKPEGKEVGFYRAVSDKITAGKCYLTISGGAKESYAFTFDPDEGTVTAINTLETVEKNGRIFNIQGQELAEPVKGINIIGGKKVIVK